MNFDSKRFRQVLGHYPTGVCVITATTADGPVGLVVGSFTSVSLDPPLVGFFPAKSSKTWPTIEKVGKFCVNVLASDQAALCGQLTASVANRFDGLSYSCSDNGSPILDQSVAWIDCSLSAVHEAGDHLIVVAEVIAMDVGRSANPLLFFRGGYGEFTLI